MRLKRLSFLLFILILILDCTLFIDRIRQPSRVKAGGIFRIRIDGHTVGESRDSGSDKAYFYLTLPVDWEIKDIHLTGSYSGNMLVQKTDFNDRSGYCTWMCTTITEFPYYPGAEFSVFITVKTNDVRGWYNIKYLAGLANNADAYWGPESLPIESY
ncbi:MAG TPA: hypothetical protein ENI34_09110 [candidate division WOR-3 bacterium]|uniref:Uncharacterized protein n=1 Tax=candidate division WOR-3 bacterium TaxID=2052148 RepID=A0A9C9ENL6_UNCW3|nr:hypothetical protein [candidate division WOR-3 bacterium]